MKQGFYWGSDSEAPRACVRNSLLVIQDVVLHATAVAASALRKIFHELGSFPRLFNSPSESELENGARGFLLVFTKDICEATFFRVKIYPPREALLRHFVPRKSWLAMVNVDEDCYYDPSWKTGDETDVEMTMMIEDATLASSGSDGFRKIRTIYARGLYTKFSLAFTQ